MAPILCWAASQWQTLTIQLAGEPGRYAAPQCWPLCAPTQHILDQWTHTSHSMLGSMSMTDAWALTFQSKAVISIAPRDGELPKGCQQRSR